MNGNGSIPHGDTTKSDLIDRVLDGKDADTKARVLDLIYRLKLEPTDELFLFCVAIGYLETIIVDAPEQWQQIFTTFANNLKQWKTNHLETLETSTTFVEQLTIMTHSLTEQTTYTDDIAKGLMTIHRQLKDMEKQSPSWGAVVKSLTESLEGRQKQLLILSRDVNQLRDELQKERREKTTSITPTSAPSITNGYSNQAKAFQNPYQTETGTQSVQTNRINPVVNFLLLLVLLLTGYNVWILQEQKKVTNWLLIKANRAECRQGIVSSDSPQCQGI